MKSLFYVVTALAVFALASWAYRENYATQQVMNEAQTLQRQIGAAQERLNVLRAEWAYLNRPARLLELAEINFDRLGLLALRPDQFGRVDEVGFPPPPALPIVNPIEVSSQRAPTGGGGT